MSQDERLAAYRLTEWPFREVPEASRCTFIAGRPDLKATIERMLATSQAAPVSSIHLFWASLGAGKTHALYYLTNRMRGTAGFLPVYTEYPESPATFLEVYEGFAQRIDWDAIAEDCLHLFASREPDANAGLAQIRLVQPDIHRAFFLLAEGEDAAKAKLARRWLRGEQLAKTELRTAALSKALHTPADCAAAISVLARVLALKAEGKQVTRLVWILDEAQRLKEAGPRLNHEMNAGLQSTFNGTPDHFTLILSFSGKPQAELPSWIRPELGDRIGARNLVLLPGLGRDQARVFLRELLAHYRRGTAEQPYFPFSDIAVETLIARLMKKGKDGSGEAEGIPPRQLIKYCHAALLEHMDSGKTPPIDEAVISRLLDRS